MYISVVYSTIDDARYIVYKDRKVREILKAAPNETRFINIYLNMDRHPICGEECDIRYVFSGFTNSHERRWIQIIETQ